MDVDQTHGGGGPPVAAMPPAPGDSPPLGAAPVSLLDPETALSLLRADPEMFAAFTGEPLLAVRVCGPRALEVAAFARRLPCVLVGVAADPADAPSGVESAGFDVLLTPQNAPPAPWVGPLRPGQTTGDALAAIAATARAVPSAAVAFAQLVRYSAGVDVDDAVVAESFTYSTLQGGPEFAAWLAGHRAERERRAARRAAAGGPAPAPEGRPATAPTTDPAVLVERDGDELWVVLNRPRVHNAVSRDVRDGLVSAFALAGADPSITRVRLRGAGRTFCSGGDLAEFGTLPDPARAHAVRTTRSIPLALLRCGRPVTAYVHGTCVGAGVEIPAFAERVVADPATTFRLPELAMGLVPGAGGTSSIVRRVGRERTAFMALTGWALDTSVAADWGLVDEVRPVGGDQHPER
ncbi:enoyl-CoA hydratase/isomerase family protein [Frankia sp. CcI49]|uniref:enoyl-CoA hydratase/isomerase family protein n=1 Tax=Frankia sp. CcI49 TaxID=1745382 RepID=UPI001F52402B|nr:enoyl-CoA hydratase/isomerase family protein [Frankia sp. CcI49]